MLTERATPWYSALYDPCFNRVVMFSPNLLS